MNDNEPFVEIRTSPERADEFIERLINDEGFRATLEANPERALAEYDIRIAAELLAGPVELPSPEQLEEALKAMDAGEFSPETAHIQVHEVLAHLLGDDEVPEVPLTGELTGMPRFRRTKYLFVYYEDRQFLDIVRLLRGEAVVTPLRRILAISILTAKEHVTSRRELDLLLSIPSDEWVERSGADAQALGELAAHGLVLSDGSDDRLHEFRRRDAALSSNQWNIYSALYHFLTKWRDVDVAPEQLEQPSNLDEPETGATAAFVKAFGPGPPHFYSAPNPLEVTALPLAEREGGLWETLARRRTTRAFARGPSPPRSCRWSSVTRSDATATAGSPTELWSLGRRAPLAALSTRLRFIRSSAMSRESSRGSTTTAPSGTSSSY